MSIGDAVLSFWGTVVDFLVERFDQKLDTARSKGSRTRQLQNPHRSNFKAHNTLYLHIQVSKNDKLALYWVIQLVISGASGLDRARLAVSLCSGQANQLPVAALFKLAIEKFLL